MFYSPTSYAYYTMEYQEPLALYNKLREYLSIPLPKKKLFEHLSELDAIRYELAEERSKALQALCERKAKSLYPKENDKTDLDRKVMLDGFTAEMQRIYEFLASLEQIVSDRLKLGRIYLQKSDL